MQQNGDETDEVLRKSVVETEAYEINNDVGLKIYNKINLRKVQRNYYFPEYISGRETIMCFLEIHITIVFRK